MSIRRLILLLILLTLPLTGVAQGFHQTASTYFGGMDGEGGCKVPIALGPQGDVYVACRTESLDLLVPEGAAQVSYRGQGDIAIARFDRNLSMLKALTYFGGTREDGAWPGIDMVASEDAVFVVMGSNSSDLPCSQDAFQERRRGSYDLVIARFSLDLTTLEACTYLGGIGSEAYPSLLLRSDGDVVVAGSTTSFDFPTPTGTAGPISGGANIGDIFVARLSSDLTTLHMSQVLGGSGDDVNESIALLPDGSVLLAGWTSSPDLLPLVNRTAYHGGVYDGYVIRLSPSLDEATAATYVGGLNWDFAYSIAASSDHIAVVGHTASLDVPTIEGAVKSAYSGAGGADRGDDAYIMLLEHDLETIGGSYLGGFGWENATAVRPLDGGWLVAGQTSSPRFSLVDALIRSRGDNQYAKEGFVIALDSQLTGGSGYHLGGSGVDYIGGILVGYEGRVLVAMSTTTPSLPTGSESWNPDYVGGQLILENMLWGGDLWLGEMIVNP